MTTCRQNEMYIRAPDIGVRMTTHSSNTNIAACTVLFIPQALRASGPVLSIPHAAYSMHVLTSHKIRTLWIKDPTQRSHRSF